MSDTAAPGSDVSSVWGRRLCRTPSGWEETPVFEAIILLRKRLTPCFFLPSSFCCRKQQPTISLVQGTTVQRSSDQQPPFPQPRNSTLSPAGRRPEPPAATLLHTRESSDHGYGRIHPAKGLRHSRAPPRPRHGGTDPRRLLLLIIILQPTGPPVAAPLPQ